MHLDAEFLDEQQVLSRIVFGGDEPQRGGQIVWRRRILEDYHRKPSERIQGWRRRQDEMSRLHIGSGSVSFPGWMNIDIKPLEGVDLVHDVTAGLPFSDVQFIFSEHFLEHLSFSCAADFLRECRQTLAPGGVLRLSTPNLDWVLKTHYHQHRWTNSHETVRDCFMINKAFRGWGHEFLYNQTTLLESLLHAGFGEVEFLQYGESTHDVLCGLESHERNHDLLDEQHVLIAEASGYSEYAPQHLAQFRDEYLEAVNNR